VDYIILGEAARGEALSVLVPGLVLGRIDITSQGEGCPKVFELSLFGMGHKIDGSVPVVVLTYGNVQIVCPCLDLFTAVC
jgi:hypothetical protein